MVKCTHHIGASRMDVGNTVRINGIRYLVTSVESLDPVPYTIRIPESTFDPYADGLHGTTIPSHTRTYHADVTRYTLQRLRGYARYTALQTGAYLSTPRYQVNPS